MPAEVEAQEFGEGEGNRGEPAWSLNQPVAAFAAVPLVGYGKANRLEDLQIPPGSPAATSDLLHQLRNGPAAA